MEVAPREVTPLLIQTPTAKEKKYDRQLRLWAASGQRALEESHVLLVVGDSSGSNSSVTGSETLKNLILPSIGNFTIVDSAKVTEVDLGVNFFLEADSLGKSRAGETNRLLGELNPDVTGHVVSQCLDDWLSQNENALEPYNLILLCAPISPFAREKICSYAQARSIPLIYIHTVGFFSYFSIQLPSEFPIVDTHPDPDSISDLRLFAPWPELVAQVKAIGDFKDLSDHDHGHIPYLLILLHYLEEWKSLHDNQYPDTFKEKTQFRDLVRSGARTDNAERGEENFDEACAAVLKTITPPIIGSGCREMFALSSCTNLTKTSSNFWIIANAIKSFYEKHKVLPLPGGLPDMKAKSGDYISLQNTYKSKARKDVAEVLSSVRSLEGSLGRQDPVPESEVESFCKNASHVKVLQGRTLPHMRLDADPEICKKLASELENEDSLIPIFIALLHNDRLSESCSRALIEHITSRSTQDPDDEKNAESPLSKAITETSRALQGELHNIASITGGMVAQEAIKLITRQYVPVDNTCIYDSILSRSMTIRL